MCVFVGQKRCVVHVPSSVVLRPLAARIKGPEFKLSVTNVHLDVVHVPRSVVLRPLAARIKGRSSSSRSPMYI